MNEIVKNVTDALLQAKNAQEGARNAIEISQRDIAMAFDILRNVCFIVFYRVNFVLEAFGIGSFFGRGGWLQRHSVINAVACWSFGELKFVHTISPRLF